MERKNKFKPAKEMEYADDCDFMTEIEKRKEITYKKAKEILTESNLY